MSSLPRAVLSTSHWVTLEPATSRSEDLSQLGYTEQHAVELFSKLLKKTCS